MIKKYNAILTEAGRDKLATAALSGVPVGFSEMAVGDGGGTLPTPAPSQDGLINECYRAPLNRLVIADQSANIIRAEMIMPPQIGGFWMREAALFDDTGVCLAVANLPESYKPQLAEGAGRFQIVNIWIAVSSTVDVQLITDPSIVIATVEEVQRVRDEAKDYTDEMVSELGESIKIAIDAAVKGAIRTAWESDNPIGTSRLFNQNVNPNDRWPWSTWEYAGEHLTIRTAKADGSDVGAHGGGDTVNITRDNLPAAELSVSGSTAEQPAQKLQTTPGGGHWHQGGMAAPGDVWDDDYVVGSDNDSRRTRNYTSGVEDHAHQITVPEHAHTVWAQTEAMGQGQPISIVERHKLQMLWYRTA